MTPLTVHGSSPGLCQACIVPRCTRQSPGTSSVSDPSSNRSTSRPEMTVNRSSVGVRCIPGPLAASGGGRPGSFDVSSSITARVAASSLGAGYPGGSTNSTKFSDPGGGRNDPTLSTGSWPSATVSGGTAACHGYVSTIPPTLDSVTSAATGPSRSTLDTPSRSTPVTTTRTAIPTAFSSHTPVDQRCASHPLAAAPPQRGNAAHPTAPKRRVCRTFRERRGRDSNPRWRLSPHTRLAGECLQPLGHLSGSCGV